MMIAKQGDAAIQKVEVFGTVALSSVTINNVKPSSVAVYNVPGTTLTANANMRDGSGVAITSTLTNTGRQAVDVHQGDANFSMHRSSVVSISYFQNKSIECKTFTTQTPDISITNVAETNIFLFSNLSTNTVSVRMERGTYISASNSNVALFRTYRGSVASSSGTLIVPYPHNTACTNSSAIRTFYSPTATPGMLNHMAVASDGTPQFLETFDGSRIFGPGTSFLVTVKNSVANKSVALRFEWIEE